jgi:hypothetical protein
MRLSEEMGKLLSEAGTAGFICAALKGAHSMLMQLEAKNSIGAPFLLQANWRRQCGAFSQKGFKSIAVQLQSAKRRATRCSDFFWLSRKSICSNPNKWGESELWA